MGSEDERQSWGGRVKRESKGRSGRRGLKLSNLENQKLQARSQKVKFRKRKNSTHIEA